jgi:transcription initiation factor TFIIB
MGHPFIENDNPIWKFMPTSSCGFKPSTGSDCTYCGCTEIFVIDGLATCSSCRSIVERMIDYGAEWRFFSGDADRNGGGTAANPTRCCPPANALIPTMGCIVGGSGGQNRVVREASPGTVVLTNRAMGDTGPVASPLKSNDVQRYHFWNSMSYRERSLCSVFEQLSMVALRSGIPHIILEEAKHLYKNASALKVTRGDNRKALIACSMYIACKLNKVPRSTKEIAVIFDMDSRIITRGCKLFQDAMDVPSESSRAEDYVRRFCSKLRMDATEREFTERIVECAVDMDIVCDFIPTSIVSGAIHMASVELDIGISKKEIGLVCHISVVTLMKCYKRLNEFREEILRRVDGGGA